MPSFLTLILIAGCLFAHLGGAQQIAAVAFIGALASIVRDSLPTRPRRTAPARHVRSRT